MRCQDWENHSWKHLSLIGDERIINLQRTKVYVFSDSVLCLGKIFENPESNEAWEQRLGRIKSSQNNRNFDRIHGEPMEFEWNTFPGFNTLQLSEEVKSLLYRLGETPENFTGRILFISMFNDISCGTKDNEKECLANARLDFFFLPARCRINIHAACGSCHTGSIGLVAVPPLRRTFTCPARPDTPAIPVPASWLRVRSLRYPLPRLRSTSGTRVHVAVPVEYPIDFIGHHANDLLLLPYRQRFVKYLCQRLNQRTPAEYHSRACRLQPRTRSTSPRCSP